MSTIREQIIGLVITYLGADTPTPKTRPDVPPPPTKPVGLVIHRERTRALESDRLPAILVYFEDETPRPISSHYGAPLVERELGIVLEHRAQATVMNPTPDQAIDGLYAWSIYQLFANESFGGIANVVVEGKTTWHWKEGDVPIAAASTHLTIKYRTSRIDPSART